MAIDSGLKMVSDLFSGDRLFEIPPYQRPYAWDAPQVLDMLDDIRYVGTSKAHFFGTILLKDSGKRRHLFDVVEIVDGQQRLTTLQILVAECLRKLQKSLESAMSHRLEERYLAVDGNHKLTPSAFD